MTMTLPSHPRGAIKRPPSKEAAACLAAKAALTARRRERHVDGKMYLVETYDRPLYNLSQLSTKAARTNMPLLTIETSASGKVSIKFTELGEMAKAVLKADWPMLIGTYCHHKLSPVLKFFLQLLRFFPLETLVTHTKGPMSLIEAQRFEKAAARVLAIVRKRLRSAQMKRAVDNFSRNARNNFGSFMNGVDWLAERHRHVVSVRLDLFLDNPPQPPLPLGVKPDIKVAARLISLRERFMRWLRETYQGSLLTTAWALEHGRHRGYHIHFWAVFTPDSTKAVKVLAEVLGQKWKDMTGGSKDCYFNCHEKVNEYRYRMIGHIDFQNPNTIMGVRALCAYFTAANLFVKLDLGGQRTFGMKGFPNGPLKKPGPKPKMKPPIMRVPLHLAAERFVTWI